VARLYSNLPKRKAKFQGERPLHGTFRVPLSAQEKGKEKSKGPGGTTPDSAYGILPFTHGRGKQGSSGHSSLVGVGCSHHSLMKEKAGFQWAKPFGEMWSNPTFHSWRGKWESRVPRGAAPWRGVGCPHHLPFHGEGRG
jgi:hypothetical protein